MTKVSTLHFSLLELGTAIQEAVKDGYEIVEGWPMLFGRMYELQVQKPEVETKKAGRPAKGS